jgi:hypothetical protein
VFAFRAAGQVATSMARLSNLDNYLVAMNKGEKKGGGRNKNKR